MPHGLEPYPNVSTRLGDVRERERYRRTMANGDEDSVSVLGAEASPLLIKRAQDSRRAAERFCTCK